MKTNTSIARAIGPTDSLSFEMLLAEEVRQHPNAPDSELGAPSPWRSAFAVRQRLFHALQTRSTVTTYQKTSCQLLYNRLPITGRQPAKSPPISTDLIAIRGGTFLCRFMIHAHSSTVAFYTLPDCAILDLQLWYCTFG
jgi:hypothetical protein